MPKRTPNSIELSRLSGGIDRFNRYAEMGAEKAVEGLNVIEDDGDLRRRDAFRAIGAAAPHFLPAGRTVLQVDGPTYLWNREFSETVTSYPGTNDLIINCIGEQFDGFWWGHVASVGTVPTTNAVAVVEYWNGTGWTEMPRIVDTTRLRVENGNDEWLMSLYKDGTISWHTSQFASAWVSRTIDEDGGNPGIDNVYSVRVRLLLLANGAEPVSTADWTGLGTLTLEQPGCLCFKLGPVRSLFPVRMRDGMSAVLVGSDRQVPRGQQPGGMLGVFRDLQDWTQPLIVLDTRGDEGSGVVDEDVQPDILRGAPGIATPAGGGSWTTHASYGTSFGSANAITKHQQDSNAINFYQWYTDQFRGDPFAVVVPASNIEHDATRMRTSFRYTYAPGALLSEFGNNAFEGCKLRCITNGSGGGTAVGDEREIYLHTSDQDAREGYIFVHEHFAIEPDLQNVFEIVRPHARATIFPVSENSSMRRYEITGNDPTFIDLQDGSVLPYVTRPATEQSVDCHFVCTRNIEDQLPAGEFWTAAYDINSKQLYLANGFGVFFHDGVLLRKFFPITDENSPRVKAWIGAMPDQVRDLLRAVDLAGSKLRGNLDGAQLIVDFAGRLVLANFADRPNSVVYSAPAPDIDIWPNLYETEIRDQENNEIRAMFTLAGQLVVATPTSMHVADHPGPDGALRFLVASSGVGFLSHRAVAKLGDNFAIGPTADGLRIFDGFSLTKVVDRWERIIEGGVNLAKMNISAGAAFYRKNEYYLAFPSAGSAVNDKVLVYNVPMQKVWIWDAPWGGISDIARDFDERGNERLLFGFNDGHIAILTDAATDDGDAIEGYAKSPLIQPDGGHEFTATALLVTMNEVDDVVITYTMNQRPFEQTPERDFRWADDGERFSTGLFNTALFSADPFITKRINLQHGLRSKGELFQFAIRGSQRWRLRSVEMLVSGPSVGRSGN